MSFAAKLATRSPKVLTASLNRTRLIKKIAAEEQELCALGQKILSENCYLSIGVEVEATAVLPESKTLDTFYITKPVRETLFHESPYIKKVVKEPTIEGHTDLTHDGRFAVQIEFVTDHVTRLRCLAGNDLRVDCEPSGGRRVSPSELARILEILPKFVNAQAREYGLDRVDFIASPFKGEHDQTCGLQANLNLSNQSGKNLFDTDHHANGLMQCFVLELNRSDQDALALLCPSPDAFNPPKRLCRSTILRFK